MCLYQFMILETRAELGNFFRSFLEKKVGGQKYCCQDFLTLKKIQTKIKSYLGMAQFSAAKPVKNTSSKWKNGKCIDSLNKHLAAGRVVT